MSAAEKRGRNAKWVEKAIRESVSITETEALKKNVIDLVATDLLLRNQGATAATLVPAGHLPDVEEARQRLEILWQSGPQPDAFSFRKRFAADGTPAR